MGLYSPTNIVNIYDDIISEYPSLRRGGVAVAKTGYHDSVNGNRAKDPDDYSIRLSKDLKGDFDAGRAIDLTMNESDMIKCGKRLLEACVEGDPRVYGMREFIGTINGRNVIAYNREGDGQGGSRSTAGIKHDEEAGAVSHLWHTHISFYTIYATSSLATLALTEILLGEPMEVRLNDEDKREIARLAAKFVWDHPVVDVFAPLPGQDPTNEHARPLGVVNWLVASVQSIRQKIGA